MDIITLVLSSDEDHSAANVSVDSYSVSCSHDLSADIQQQIDGSSYHGYIPFLVESYPLAVWPYVNNNREKKVEIIMLLDMAHTNHCKIRLDINLNFVMLWTCYHVVPSFLNIVLSIMILLTHSAFGKWWILFVSYKRHHLA